jgi:hypothetical protein
MHPGRFLTLITEDEHERRRRDDEAFRAWHRRPDALPDAQRPASAPMAADRTLPRRASSPAPHRSPGLALLLGRLRGWGLVTRR